MCKNSLEICSDLVDRMKDVAARFAEKAKRAQYVVYAILDPTKTDPAARYPALPFYVGETKNARDRSLSHMRHALMQKDLHQPTKSEIHRIMQADQLPEFIVLERCSTRADSLEAELRWSQQLLKWNYTLSNCLPGQSRIISKRHYHRLIANRLWKLTLAEAHAAGISMELFCPTGCYRTEVDLSAFEGSETSGRRLAALKKTVAACSCCQSEPTVAIAESNGAHISWRRGTQSAIDLPQRQSPRRQ